MVSLFYSRTFLLALVTTTAGLVWSVESLLTSPPRGFSVAAGPGEPARLWSRPSTEDFRLDLVGIVGRGQHCTARRP